MTGRGERLGQIWVMTLFAATSVVLVFPDYGTDSPILHHVVLAGVSALVTFSVIAVLYWLGQMIRIGVPAPWHRLRRWEGVAAYRRLGVRAFRSWLLRSPFRALNADVHLTERSRAGLQRLDGHMRQAEANHLIAFVLTVGATIAYAIYNQPWFALWLSVLNVVVNVYPILLQRYNRLRLGRVLERVAR